jgi:hypothetical protein
MLSSILKDRIRGIVLAIDGEDASEDDIDQLSELLRTHPYLARYVACVMEQQAALEILGTEFRRRRKRKPAGPMSGDAVCFKRD